MTNWAAIGIVAAAEVATFLGATVKAYSAQSRLGARDDDVRAAVAGYESGLVTPALAELVQSVIDIRRPGEAIRDALSRADVNEPFGDAVEASIKSETPRTCERALIGRYEALAGCLTAAQVAGPVAIYNNVKGGYNLPHNLVIVAAVIFSLGVAGALLSALMVRAGENLLSQVIREGKDAA